MKSITIERLEEKRRELIAERDGYLAKADELRATATAVGGAVTIIEACIAEAREQEQEK